MNQKWLFMGKESFFISIQDFFFFHETLNMYTFVEVSGLTKKTSDFFSINFHVDIDMKKPKCIFLLFSRSSIVRHLS